MRVFFAFITLKESNAPKIKGLCIANQTAKQSPIYIFVYQLFTNSSHFDIRF